MHTKSARIIPVVPELIADRPLKAAQPNLFASPYQIPIGMNYASMEYESIHLLKTGALGICGREGMGRTNLVMYILHTLQENILQHDVEAYVVDDLNQRLQLSESYGCVVRYTINATDAVEIVEELYETLQSRKEAVKAMGVPVSEAVKEMPLLLLILSGSDAVQMLSAKSAIQEKLMALTKDFVPYRSCVIVTGIANEKVSYSGPAILKALLERGPVFLFEDVNNIRLLDITNSQKNRYQTELKPGDCYLWQNAKLSKIRTIYHEWEQ